MARTTDACPFGPELQIYWDKRYKLFSKFDEGIQLDEEGLYSAMPETTGLEQAKHIVGSVIYDAFAGVGGTSIAYARAGKQVIATDINAKRLAMAEHNAQIYGVSNNIDFICADFFKMASHVEAHTVVLDPPWGGPAYKSKNVFHKENLVAQSTILDNPDGHAILNLALRYFSEVVLRVPLNFDLSELNSYNHQSRVYDDVLDERVICRTVVFSS